MAWLFVYFWTIHSDAFDYFCFCAYGSFLVSSETIWVLESESRSPGFQASTFPTVLTLILRFDV